MKRISWIMVLTVALCSVTAVAQNSVVVTSMSVTPGETGVVIPVLLTNDVNLKFVVVPLALREQTPGAFVTSLGLSFGDRLPVGGPLSEIAFRNHYAAEDGECKDDAAGGFGTISFGDGGPNAVAASPEGVLFVRQRLFSPELTPGADVTGSLILTVDVTAVDGTFEIDTTCANPANHLLFARFDNFAIIPDFTKGIITIGTGGSTNTDPEALCQDVTVDANGSCEAVASIDDGSFDPDGDPITLSQDPPDPYPLGATLVTLTVADDQGGSATCQATVTVADNTDPTITCPAAIAVQCSDDIPAPDVGSVTASDNCGPPTITHVGDVSDGLSCPETITRTYRATDASGNEAECTRTITVNDTENPQITLCPGDVAVECDADIPPVDIGAVTATDNCGPVTITHEGDTPSGPTCPKTITRVYRATDGCGNFAECGQIITVEDTQDPQITGCPGDVTVACLEDVPPSDIGAVTADDNCGAVTVTHEGDVSDGLTCPETITRTYRATDDCGNFAECMQIITVHDTEDPAVTCPADIEVNVLSGQTSAVVDFAANVTDNCDGATVTCVPPSGSDFPVGQTTVTCTGEDLCGNITECTFLITVTEVVSNPPIANDDYKFTRGGAVLQAVAPGVLVNDTDPDGDPLTAVLDADVGIGTLTLNPDGSFDYIAPVEFVGVVSFTYFANDGTVNSTAPATVTITVRQGRVITVPGDFDGDGFLTVTDLSAEIDAVFAGGPNPIDPTCFSQRADFNCDGISDVLDVQMMIDHLFAGGEGPGDPCAK